MTRLHVTMDLDMLPDSGCDRYQVENYIDGIMQELLNIEAGDNRIADSSLDVNFAEMSLRVSMLVEAADEDEVQQLSVNTLRTAIHVAGGRTPGWSSVAGDKTEGTNSVNFSEATYRVLA